MDNNDNSVRLAVTLSMKDGRKLVGDLIANMGGTLERTLNNEAKFILFDSEESQRMIAKDGILEVEPRKVVKKGELPDQPASNSTNPYKVLEISRSASDEEITTAFMEKVEIYRPDRFTNNPLPPEMADYLNTKYRNIYDAHQTLMQGKTPALTQQ